MRTRKRVRSRLRSILLSPSNSHPLNETWIEEIVKTGGYRSDEDDEQGDTGEIYQDEDDSGVRFLDRFWGNKVVTLLVQEEEQEEEERRKENSNGQGNIEGCTKENTTQRRGDFAEEGREIERKGENEEEEEGEEDDEEEEDEEEMEKERKKKREKGKTNRKDAWDQIIQKQVAKLCQYAQKVAGKDAILDGVSAAHLNSLMQHGGVQIMGPKIRDNEGRRILYTQPHRLAGMSAKDVRTLTVFFLLYCSGQEDWGGSKGFTVVHDCQQLSSLDCFRLMNKISWRRYAPDGVAGGCLPLRKIFIINTPPFYALVWKLFSSFLSNKLKQRVSVLPTTEDLVQFVPLAPLFLTRERHGQVGGEDDERKKKKEEGICFMTELSRKRKEYILLRRGSKIRHGEEMSASDGTASDGSSTEEQEEPEDILEKREAERLILKKECEGDLGIGEGKRKGDDLEWFLSDDLPQLALLVAAAKRASENTTSYISYPTT